MKLFIFVVITCLNILVFSNTIKADVILVPEHYGSIQSAIDAASTNDTILVSPGTYYENINFHGKAIFVKGVGSPESVIINGSRPIYPDSASVVCFNNGETEMSVLDGFTLTGGAGTVTKTNGKNGGGILIDGASPHITNCFIWGNKGTLGGGVCAQLASSSANMSITFCTIYNNSALYGGGIWVNMTTGQLINCTIIKNSERTGLGSNLHLAGLAESGIEVTNCILWYGNIRANDTKGNFNHCDIQGGWSSGTGNISVYPLFCDKDLDFRLEPLSPCIGAGENGTTIGSLGTCPENFNFFDFPLDIGTSWKYKYYYFYLHMGPETKKTGTHLWQVVDFKQQDNLTRYTLREIKKDTTILTYLPFVDTTFTIDTSYFYIDRKSYFIVVRIPSARSGYVDTLKGYFDGSQAVHLHHGNSYLPQEGIIYKEGIGLASLWFENYYTHTKWEEKFELIEFKGLNLNTTVTNFTSVLEGNSVRLIWNAEIGLNFLRFEVERMVDDKTWLSLGDINGKPGSQSFLFSDNSFNNSAQVLRYRIKIVNLDNSSSFSDTKELFLVTRLTNFDCIFKTVYIEVIWNAIIGLSFEKFEIERSIDDKLWNSKAEFNEKNITGNPFIYKDSSFNKKLNHVKYRIKITNNDNSFSYSEVKEVKVIPDAYYLAQNYPNPFNTITTIEFSIPKQSNVKFEVFDLLGRKVATLIAEEKAAGNYRLEYTGSNLSSGIYFYRLEAGGFSETKKLILLK